MVRKVQFEGRNIIVPDDATDDEVAQILGGDTPQEKPWAGGFEIANIAGGVIEPITKMATGFVAKPVGEVAGMLSGLGDVISGGRLGGRNASEVSQDIQKAMTYAPKTQAGRSSMNPLNFIPEKIGESIQAVANPIANAVTGENAAPSSFRKMAGDAVREAIPQAANIGMVKAFPMPKTPAELAAKSYQDAARIESAKLAVDKYGLSINPVVSNPTKPNSIRVAAGGHEYMDALSRRHNEPLTGEILKGEIGIPKETSLTSTAPFDAVRESAGKAKNQIQLMKDFLDDGTAAATISALTPKSTIGMSAVKASINRQIKEANLLLGKNPTGAELIAEIETLRKAARKTYAMKEAAQPLVDIADAKMGMANAFEAMIERNLSVRNMPDLLEQYVSGRKTMAKSYTLEHATDFNTGIVDPMFIAKMTAKDNALDGAFADIGKIAGNFPSSMSSKAGAAGGYKEFATTHATRTGAGGMAGYVLGGMFGQPLLGAALGGAAGEFGGRWYGNQLTTNPAVQKAIAIPKDFRPPPIPAAVPPAPTSRVIPINKTIYDAKNLPSLDVPVIPVSWREGMLKNVETGPGAMDILVANPLLGPQSELAIKASREGTYPSLIGSRAETSPYKETPLPMLPTMERGMLSLSDIDPIPRPLPKIESIPFKTRLDVMNTPVMKKAVASFIDEAESIKSAISIESNGFKKSALEARLRGVENRFMAGLKQMGIRNESEARNLMRKVYETGGETQRGIEKVFTPKFAGAQK